MMICGVAVLMSYGLYVEWASPRHARTKSDGTAPRTKLTPISR